MPALDRAEQETLLGSALQKLMQQNLEGLETLLSVPGMAVVFGGPPAAADATAWNLLETAPDGSTVVVGYPSANHERRDNWTSDRVAMEGEMGVLAALESYRETLAMLAVCDGPTNLAALADVTGERSQEVEATGLTIAMPSGVVLGAGARDAIRSQLGDEVLKAAHRRVFEARQVGLIESDDIFARVRNLVGADAAELTEFVNTLAETEFRRGRKANG